MQEKPPSELWEGGGARSIRVITSWLPLWLSVSLFLLFSPYFSADGSQDKLWYRKFELRKLEV
jgi:hypothetical protein